MTDKEKAKAYDEALEKAREALSEIPLESYGARKIIEDAFPELRASKDERIRKWLLKCVKSLYDVNFREVSRQDVIFYLEKQKETGIRWFKSDNVKNPDKPYIDKAGMFYTTDGRMCYASEIEKQKGENLRDFIDGFPYSDEQKEQKPVEWSKEDEVRLKEAIDALNDSVKDYLNSLRLSIMYDHLKELM